MYYANPMNAPTTKRKYVIEGTHRNRECYVTNGEKGSFLSGNVEIFFCMERNEDTFMGQAAGFSYFVRAVSPKYRSFMADSWKDAVRKLHAILS